MNSSLEREFQLVSKLNQSAIANNNNSLNSSLI